MEEIRDISIITPSYKRAGEIKAVGLFQDDLIIACHEFEANLYKEAYSKNKIMILPDDTKKNMAKVRNFIYKNCGTKYLLMVDDDVKEIGYTQKGKNIAYTKDKLYSFIENSFKMCEDAGTILWGVRMVEDPCTYHDYSPFTFLSCILGPFCGHIIDKNIEYDERLGLNEDYDFSLQVLRKYHKILRFERNYYKAGHLKQKGGCGAYRILDEEKRQAEIMIKKWGGKVVKYDFKKSTNPKINIPIKGT